MVTIDFVWETTAVLPDAKKLREHTCSHGSLSRAINRPSTPMTTCRQKKSKPRFDPAHLPGSIFWGLLIFAAFGTVFRQLSDVDLWWHLHFGREFLHTFKVPELQQFYLAQTRDSSIEFRYTLLGDAVLFLLWAVGGGWLLQGFQVGITLFALILMDHMTGRRRDCLALLGLMAFLFSTYHLQIVRNSLFSYGLLMMLLWITWRHDRNSGSSALKTLGPAALVVGFWGLFHGSYLIGMAMLGIVLAADVFDALLAGKSRSVMSALWKNSLIGAVAFSTVLIGNPLTAIYTDRLLTFAREIAPDSRVKSAAKSDGAPSVKTSGAERAADETSEIATPPDDSIWRSLISTLNNTVISTASMQKGYGAVSGDFQSPFDAMSHAPIPATFMLMFPAAVGLVWFLRPFRVIDVALFAVCLPLGLGYLRGIPFLAAVSVWVLLRTRGSPGRNAIPKVPQPLQLAALVVCISWTLSSMALWIVDRHCELLAVIHHVTAPGRSPAFSERMASYILENHRHTPCFTTITTGGYALLSWNGAKPVFMAGKFDVYDENIISDYVRVADAEQADGVLSRYGLKAAWLSAGADLPFQKVFLKNDAWHIAAVEAGAMLFVHEDALERRQLPTVLETMDELRRVQGRYVRAQALHPYFGVLEKLLRQQRFKDALDFYNLNIDRFALLGAWRQPDQENYVRSIMQSLQAAASVAITDREPRAPVYR